MSRVLALDYGRARGGCAVSDPTGTLTTPLPIVERPPTRRGMAAIRRLVAEHAVERVVVGLPLTLRGEEGPQAQETRAFADRLGSSLAVPVELHDERFTTRQAARAVQAGGGGAAAEDSRAAAHLLEAYLAAATAATGVPPGEAVPEPAGR
jgi:putative Holliday junction resolvase